MMSTRPLSPEEVPSGSSGVAALSAEPNQEPPLGGAAFGSTAAAGAPRPSRQADQAPAIMTLRITAPFACDIDNNRRTTKTSQCVKYRLASLI
jgi:hypothetical protein